MLAIYQVQCITGIPLHTNMQSDRLRFHSTVTTLHMGEIIYQIDQHNYGWIRRKINSLNLLNTLLGGMQQFSIG